ncbi:hypothetical protein E2C01_013002 [Portunus trituberculatus]|uniref:Uncharacterized protein n=1 Tax=Portunus trituberculatus TaxID=210409 RepID=A0A5B7DF34_PORTR|nr:hypothetical protein [Portunus trituberculatus]
MRFTPRSPSDPRPVFWRPSSVARDPAARRPPPAEGCCVSLVTGWRINRPHMEDPSVHARDYSGLFRVGLTGAMRQDLTARSSVPACMASEDRVYYRPAPHLMQPLLGTSCTGWHLIKR